jgi:Cu(I)-responsive transcriptional regulator
MGYPMNIGEAARAAGVTAKMIRHYEGFGLIPEAQRSDGGYRLYTERDVTMLRFIRQSRSMGFSIKQIEQLLVLWTDSRRESREVKALAREHIAELDRKMAEITQMKASLELIADGCEGDERADCPILSRLSGGAAGQQREAPRKPLAKARGAEHAQAAPLQWRDAGGLTAWMQGLQRTGGSAPA